MGIGIGLGSGICASLFVTKLDQCRTFILKLKKYRSINSHITVNNIVNDKAYVKLVIIYGN